MTDTSIDGCYRESREGLATCARCPELITIEYGEDGKPDTVDPRCYEHKDDQ